jgi:hypothetical protein
VPLIAAIHATYPANRIFLYFFHPVF